jgi:hypothetical protein
MFGPKKLKADPQSRKQLAAALVDRGFQPIGNRSKQFEAFELVVEGQAPFTYFIGRDGELRMSRSATLADSISLKSLDVYSRLLQEGRALLGAGQ